MSQPLIPTGAAPSPATASPPKRFDPNTLDAGVTWQELQGIADRVRIIRRMTYRLTDALNTLIAQAKKKRDPALNERSST